MPRLIHIHCKNEESYEDAMRYANTLQNDATVIVTLGPDYDLRFVETDWIDQAEVALGKDHALVKFLRKVWTNATEPIAVSDGCDQQEGD